jgi:hypothetical protein
MKVSQLKNIVKEAVKEAIQEEIKDILLEAVKAPKQVIQSTPQSTNLPETDKVKLRENMMGVLDSMRPGVGGNISATTNDIPLQVTNADTAGPNGQLPQGNVSMDQIMGLMNKK